MPTEHHTLEEEETPLSEIVKADIPRVDGVLGPANGMPFLLLKAEGEQPDAAALEVSEGALAKGGHKCWGQDCGDGGGGGAAGGTPTLHGRDATALLEGIDPHLKGYFRPGDGDPFGVTSGTRIAGELKNIDATAQSQDEVESRVSGLRSRFGSQNVNTVRSALSGPATKGRATSVKRVRAHLATARTILSGRPVSDLDRANAHAHLTQAIAGIMAGGATGLPGSDHPLDKVLGSAQQAATSLKANDVLRAETQFASIPAVQGQLAKAQLSQSEVDALPDSAFAYIEPGGKADDDGKTTPRSKRHYPVQDASHASNALARADQEKAAGGASADIATKAFPAILAALRKFTPVKKAAELPDDELMEAVLKDGLVLVDPDDLIDPGDLGDDGGDDGDDDPMDDAPASPVFQPDGTITLTGDEAQHNAALNGAISNLKQLAQQEIGEPGDQTTDVNCLQSILGMLYAWAANEQEQGYQDDFAQASAVTKAGQPKTVLSQTAVLAIRQALQALQNLLLQGTPEEPPATPAATAPAKPSGPSGLIQQGVAKSDAADDKEAPVADQQTEQVASATETVEEPVAKAAEQQPAEVVAEAPAVEAVAKAEADQPAAAPALTVEDVQKAVAASLGEVLKSTLQAALEPIEKRLAKVEQEPIANGPFLNGRASDTDQYLIVTKGQGQQIVRREEEDLVKALGDAGLAPKDRERIGQILAQRAHPFGQPQS